MSQENVRVIRALLEAWNVGDMDSVRDAYEPDVIVRPLEGWPEPGPYVGREAVMRQWKQQRETWDTDTIDRIGEFIGDRDRVIVRCAWRGAGHGPDSSFEFTVVCTVRKGRVVYQEFFWEHSQALEAMGLSEQDAHADS